MCVFCVRLYCFISINRKHSLIFNKFLTVMNLPQRLVENLKIYSRKQHFC